MTEPIELNENHRRRLLVSCQYVDRLIADIESVLAAEGSLSPFPKYVPDLTDVEKRLTRDRIAELRCQMVQFLKSRSVTVPDPGISARHSILTSLGYIDIAVEELKARYLGGYGLVPQALVRNLDSSVEDLQATVRTTVSVLKKGVKDREADLEREP